MAFERKELINFVAETVDIARGAGHTEDADMADAVVSMLDADERRIATLETHIRQLRSCLSVMAHPTEGWPLTAITDVFVASCIDVPDGPADNTLAHLEAAAMLQMAKEWSEIHVATNVSLLDELTDLVRRRMPWTYEDVDRDTPEAEEHARTIAADVAKDIEEEFALMAEDQKDGGAQ